MFEIDFQPVGDAGRSGDAICMRFTRPDNGQQAIVVIDAGFKDDGAAIAAHVPKFYGTTKVDLAILTHPDGDHIGGMGEVIRGLNVTELWLHDLGAHGGKDLAAADAIEDLKSVAAEQGTKVREAWQGDTAFGDAITVLGPSSAYYEEMVAEQLVASQPVTKASAFREALRGLADRVAAGLGAEIPFEAKEVNARNNSSMIVLGRFDDKPMLFAGDAGVPALDKAWDYAGWIGQAQRPAMLGVPHHGSRRNCSSAWLDRLLGAASDDAPRCSAVISCVEKSDKHPSGKVVNAYKRRGCYVVATAGKGILHHGEGSARDGWSTAPELDPMIEEDD